MTPLLPVLPSPIPAMIIITYCSTSFPLWLIIVQMNVLAFKILPPFLYLLLEGPVTPDDLCT